MPVPHRPIWARIRRLLTISRLLVWSLLGLMIAILGNIVANSLQGWLGTNAWLVVLPFVLIAGVYVVGDVRRELRQLDAGTADRHAASRADPRRAQMIKLVRAIWINGFLDMTLYRKKLIALGLTTQPEAVVAPLSVRMQHVDQIARPLRAGTLMIKVFDEMGGTLLILGAPGAGKTTLLLDLARDLLDRAERTPGMPMPVVFNLASWATQRVALADWLTNELIEIYHVPRTLAGAWIAADQVLPLLDGLDEVASEHRDMCVEAINTFREDHGLVPLVVSSRNAEYHELMARLHVQGAVEVLPLTRAHIDKYLAQVGTPLAAARAALRADLALWELLDSPLMLNILTLVYGGSRLRHFRPAARWRNDASACSRST